MSCYIVDKKVIDCIVWTAFDQNIYRHDPERFGQMLVDCNTESVNVRYGENEGPADYEFDGGAMFPVIIDKCKNDWNLYQRWSAVREYRYNTSECEFTEYHSIRSKFIEVNGILESIEYELARKAITLLAESHGWETSSGWASL